MTATDLQRWSREVAEDAGAPAFVPLARAYRREGRREAALRVVLNGLARNPENVEAHALLALLHVDAGERERAGDEWSTILRLDPGNFAASRGLGFLALEQGDLRGAERHLNAAVAARPSDQAVAQALEILARRKRSGPRPSAAGPPAPAARPAPAESGRDPARLFDRLATETPFLGALLLDGQGLVLGGSVMGDASRSELLGGLLNAAVEEAWRTVELLGLGDWQGMLLDCEEAAVHVAPVNGDAVLLTLARPAAPAGWVMRTADRARVLAQAFLESRP